MRLSMRAAPVESRAPVSSPAVSTALDALPASALLLLLLLLVVVERAVLRVVVLPVSISARDDRDRLGRRGLVGDQALDAVPRHLRADPARPPRCPSTRRPASC